MLAIHATRRVQQTAVTSLIPATIASSTIKPRFLHTRLCLNHATTAASHITPPLPTIHILRLDHLRLPIANQLRIEEALLRGSTAKDKNYFILNQPPPTEQTIVMGISNKTELLVHLDAAEADGVKLLRRFSGGGTVFIDDQCWMSTMIINRTEEDTPSTTPTFSNTTVAASTPATTSVPSSSQLIHPSTLQCFPNRLMDWTKEFYHPVFNPPSIDPADVIANPIPPFSLTGSDYCFGSRKFGGNAQTITKRRWLHHTSFLWSLDSLPRISRYLQVPAKQPEYRRGRPHSDFLVSLKEVWERVEPHIREEVVFDMMIPMKGIDRTNLAASTGAAHSLFPRSKISYHSTSERSRRDGSVAVDYSHPNHPRHDHHLSSPNRSKLGNASQTLTNRVLDRLANFFTLYYPTLDEIQQLVAQYESEATSAIKELDYQEERLRIQQQRQQAAAEASATTATPAAFASSSA